MSAIGFGQKLRPDVSTPARWTAVGLEDQIRHDLLETGGLIAPDGTWVVMPRAGTPTHVTFTSLELSRVIDATLTHNHPRGTGPSNFDVMLGARYEMREMRVVTPDHRFIVAGLAGISFSRIQAEYTNEEMRVERTLNDEVRRNLLHPNDFEHELLHRVWQRVSSLLGFTYRMERS